MEARSLLTGEQRVTYKRIISHVKQRKPSLFFIDGLGGMIIGFSYRMLKVRLCKQNL